MIYRRAIPQDYLGIESLSAANQLSASNPDAQQQGFLSAQMSLSQVEHFANELGIVVAVEQGEVAGFLNLSFAAGDRQPPIIKQMVSHFHELRFQSRPMAEYQMFLYGPVCINSAYRGQGILRKMFDQMKVELLGKYDLGIAFVAENNPHSLAVHLSGLGMTEIGQFEFKQNNYHILAFSI